MLPILVWRAVASRLYARVGWSRARFLERKIAPHLQGGRVLDVGAGTGHTAALLARSKNRKVVMLDVAPHRGAWGQKLVGQPVAAHLSRKHRIGRVRYDGNAMPFRDGAFDSVLIAFVLHHCDVPEAVLREAARVSCGRILVLEDGAETAPSRFQRVLDAAFNLELNHPHQERGAQQWRELFGAFGLEIVAEQPFEWKLGLLRVPNTLWVLNTRETSGRG